jgi:predicted dehydrogenase
MRPIGIGLIGYGGIGRVHAMGYRMLPYAYGLPADTIRIAGVATSRPATAQTAAREIGCDFYTADYHELLAHDDVDIVDITLPNNQHAAAVEAAAAAGKHIYCEKPLAMDVAEAQRMVAAVARAGVNNQMTFNFRFFPAVQRAKQLVEEGFLGRVFSFRASYYRSSYIDPRKPTSWRQQRAVAGGGTLFDLGSHALDLVYFLLGPFASVQATLDTLIPERPAAAGSSEMVPVDVDDLALLTLRLPDGTPGTVEASRMGTGNPNELTFEIYGELGGIRFRSTEASWLEAFDARDPAAPHGGLSGFRRINTLNRFEGQRAPDPSTMPDFTRTHAECQYQFLKAVDAGRPATPSLADGLHIQAVMEAAQRSAAQGGWVNVADVLAGEPVR